MEVQSLQTVLQSAPHKLLQPDRELHNSSIARSQALLSPLAADITALQLQRQIADRASRKRKRPGARNDDVDYAAPLLRMNNVYTDGLKAEQVWQQAKRVLDSAADEVERMLGELDDADADGIKDVDVQSALQVNGDDVSTSGSDLGEEGVDYDIEGEDDSMLDDEALEEGLDGEISDFDDKEDASDSEREFDDAPEEEYIKDPNELNDGFFNIDHFNRQSQFLEHQDARGDPNDGAASDEEEIDWAINPLLENPQATFTNANTSTNKNGRGKAKEMDEDEDGPTFGDMDLNAPEGASEDEDFDAADADFGDDMLGDMSNTNEVFYKDFFAPPAKAKGGKKPKQYKSDKKAPNSVADANAQLENEEDNNALDDEMQLAMDDVHRDLLSDEDDLVDEENDDAQQPQQNLSRHEREQLELRAEIRRLEAENVAAKPWVLTGESIAPARPENALLEEDLDFERVGKPVVIPTAEANESIEALIKRRILAKEFDEVVRRRASEMANGKGTDPRRGRVQEELADTKPKRSLAEEYEDEYLRRTDAGYVDTRSEALKAKHSAIEAQWAQVSAQLDALSNWNYKPRPPEASISIRTDLPTIAMEDARPSAGAATGGVSTLAPQEVYNVHEHNQRSKAEVLTRGGTAIAREEEDRDARQRRRRREKARVRKANANAQITKQDDAADGADKKKDAGEVLSQLKKAGAKVIGKKGAVEDLKGKKAKTAPSVTSSGTLKL